MHADRRRAESFGSAARDYDRFRSGYPDALVDDLLAADPSSTLDVGCGTGTVAAALAARGYRVLGVDPDPRMAALARARGVSVEIASLEAWDSRGRLFDLITCGHAWQWVDPDLGTAKVASLLRPGGTAALFWNYHVLPNPVLVEVRRAYQLHAPELSVIGEDPSTLADVDPFAGVATMTPGQSRTYRWVRRFGPEDWAGMVGTFSDHRRLGPERLDALQRALRDVVERHDGWVEARGGTYVWRSRRRPC